MAGGVVASVLYSALYSALVHGQPSIQKPVILQFQTAFPITLIHSSALGLLVYWLVVAAYHGLGFYAELQVRERQAAVLEQLLTQARLDALKAQLHPHFLFNTLHTVSSLIHSRPETADRVVIRLSELLRASLDQGAEHEISLRQELGFLDRYLEIEQARFGDRLRVDRQIDPAALDLLVPSLILQPLAENAVRHGIGQRSQGGCLRVSACVKPGHLELSLADNGPGMGRDPVSERQGGIGLSNTRSRLVQLYGQQQRLELNVPAGGGLEVRLILPLRPSTPSLHAR
jgi:LytS/YehU family sensor histidine kinase